MFESIRKHQRILQFLLLLLIFPAFAFCGVSGYDQFLSDDDNVAKVDGARITRQEFDQAMRRQLDQMRQVLGDQIDAKLLDTPAARREVLDGLVLERVVQREAADRHLAVSDAKLRASILEIPGLKKPDGSFDMERYQSLLQARRTACGDQTHRRAAAQVPRGERARLRDPRDRQGGVPGAQRR